MVLLFVQKGDVFSPEYKLDYCNIKCFKVLPIMGKIKTAHAVFLNKSISNEAFDKMTKESKQITP